MLREITNSYSSHERIESNYPSSNARSSEQNEYTLSLYRLLRATVAREEITGCYSSGCEKTSEPAFESDTLVGWGHRRSLLLHSTPGCWAVERRSTRIFLSVSTRRCENLFRKDTCWWLWEAVQLSTTTNVTQVL